MYDGRIQEAGKGGAIHRQTRVLTRGACCDQLVAIHTQTHANTYILSLCLSVFLSLSSSLSHSLTHLYFFFFFYERGENAFYAYPPVDPVSYVGLEYQVESPTRYSLLTRTPLFSRFSFDTLTLTSRDLFSHNVKN